MGSIYAVTDINILKNIISNNQNYKVVLVGEPCKDLPRYVSGTVLIPPYKAMSYNINGDINKFIKEYRIHLSKTESDAYISAMLRAILSDINIIIYMSQDEFNMYFGVLMQHISEIYGVIIGTPNNPFNIDPNFAWIRYSNMYLYECLEVDEYLKLYPINMQIPESIIYKLVHEVKPQLSIKTLDNYRSYFDILRNSMHPNKSLTYPIRRIKK